MASDHLYLFAALATFNREIQNQLRDADTPEAIVAIAHHAGHPITLEQLRFYGPSLTGEHWVWSRQSESWRQQFFASVREPDRQAA